MTDPASSPLPMPAIITSPAGYRQSGRTGRRTWHEGSDFRAPPGTAVLAVRPGRVHAIFRDEDRRSRAAGYGNLVVLYHPREAVYTAYAHLSQIVVSPELEVQAGTVLGASGATSNGRFPRMGPHLHFAVRRPRRSGRAPWPGPYPNPDRNPALHREVWVDPAAFLARFGLETAGRRGAGPLRIRPGSHADAGLGWPASARLVTSPTGGTSGQVVDFISPTRARARMDRVHAAVHALDAFIQSRRVMLGDPFVFVWDRWRASWNAFYGRYPRDRDWWYLGNAAAWRHAVASERRLGEWRQAAEHGAGLRRAQ